MSKKLVISLVIAISVLISSEAFGQTDIGFKGIGLKLGYVDPDKIDETMGFGAIADLGTLTLQLGWEAELAYWSKSGGSDVGILSSAKYSFPVPESRFSPFMGGGLGLHIFSNGEDEARLGMHILAGMDTWVSENALVFGEFRYCFVSDLNQFWLTVGIKVKLPSYK
jgi:opacity protein-like surface antigen